MTPPRVRVAVALSVVAALAGRGASPALAGTPAPSWTITSISEPTNFAPGSSGDRYAVTVANSGGTVADGASIPIVVSDTLPPGVTATAIAIGSNDTPPDEYTPCSLPTLTCTFSGRVEAGDRLNILLTVSVSPGAPGTVTNFASVSGGGATAASTEEPTTRPTVVSSSPAGFGVASFAASVTNADGSLATQAGAHPYAATASFALNTVAVGGGKFEPAQDVKDVMVALPPGLIGDPRAVPQCPPDEYAALEGTKRCPPDSQVGVATVVDSGPVQLVPVYNMVPPNGFPAMFEFTIINGSGVLLGRVRTGGDYGITTAAADVTEINQAGGVTAVSITLWGVPGDPGHDAQRGRECIGSGCKTLAGGGFTPQPFTGQVKPFLTNPTLCGPPLTTTLTTDSWLEPGNPVSAAATTPTGPSGCGRLSFEPSITVQPDSAAADSPTGLAFGLHIPQNQNPDGLAEANLRRAVVSLPPGMTVNPAAADGLQACSSAQVDLAGPGPANCPDASKIGSVEVDTPLLDHPLPGSVYLAAQQDNPFGSLLAIYIAVDDPITGVIVKLAGRVEANPRTGQLTTTFAENPQLPFEDLKLNLFGGPRAALATPASCGTFRTTSDLTPWAAPALSDATPSGWFDIDGACDSGFSPSFSAGSVDPRAGTFSPFGVTFARSDGDQELGGIQVQTPPGLLGRIAGVPLCPEPQAAEGTCAPGSQIGHVTVAAGAGSNPVFLPEAGRQEDPVYLTGPYEGAPFGLSVVVHAEAGPFNLGTVVVRAAIDVDPHTAQITITSDALPTILQGIPFKLRMVKVVVDREEFMLNPTSCDPMTVSGTIASTRRASMAVSSHFQAADCTDLPFKPQLTASTQSNTSRADGASLTVKVASSPGQANIAKVDLELPKALPSRLSTLQKACTEAQFSANPAGCPAASAIGIAKATTPLLSTPLAGPAMLVSHGGAAFPDVELVLQGQAVTVVLDGKTQIKKGITYSHFDTVPDAPISSFETVLPEGPHSILTAYLPAKANGSLCAASLVIPTTITAQNGAQIKESTKVAVTGCAKPRSSTSARKAGHGHAKLSSHR